MDFFKINIITIICNTCLLDTSLISPAILIKDYPATTESAKMVATTRKNAENIISGHDDRLLVVVGPCSIHDQMCIRDRHSSLPGGAQALAV